MTISLDAALSGMLEQQRNIELLANNVSNANTTGYKRATVHFQDVLSTAEVLAALEGELPAGTVPVRTAGVTSTPAERTFSQGALTQTDRPLDLAIAGEGFFGLRLPDGTAAYTRDGTFDVDADGRVVSKHGHLLDPPITLPTDGAYSVRVQPDGTVVGMRPYTPEERADLPPDADPEGVHVVAGRIELSRFADVSGLVSLGENLYGESAESGAAITGPAGEGGNGRVLAGFLEGSNVDLSEEMTALTVASRAYQVNLKAYRTIEDMLRQANQLSQR